MEKCCPLCKHELDTSPSILVDEETNSIVLDGQAIKAPPKVRQVLGELIERSPRVLSRNFLMDLIYGLESDEEEPSDNIIPVFICKSRQAIKDSNYEIETVWGKGWLFRRKVLHEEDHQDQRAVG